MASQPSPANPARRRALILAIAGFVQILAAPLLWSITMGNPLLRRTGLVAWLFVADGLFMIILAVVASRRIPVLVLSVLSLTLTAFYVAAFFVMMRIPPATTIYQLASAPDFTLPDQDGRLVSLHDIRDKQRVLLVFYRG